jgi:hypothetical protein
MNTVKKFFAFSLILGMLLSFAACSPDTATTLPKATETPINVQTENSDIAGLTWTVDADGSEIRFFDDGTYIWYKNADVTNDNYYTGTFKLIRNEDAIVYLVKNYADYDLTEKGIRDEIAADVEAYGERTMENYICLVLEHKLMVAGGAETELNEDFAVPHRGYYFEDAGIAQLYNMKANVEYDFTVRYFDATE